MAEENIEVLVKFFTKDLVIVDRVTIKTWGEALLIYLKGLYVA